MFGEDDAGIVDGLVGEDHEDLFLVDFWLEYVPVYELFKPFFEVVEGLV